MKMQSCILIVLCLAKVVYSQSGNKIVPGIKLGVAFANSKLDYVNNTNTSPYTKTGLIAGGFLNMPAGKHVFFQPALLYVRKGVREGNQDQYKFPLLFNYLELPLNILYRSPAGKGTYFIGGGVSPAVRFQNEFNETNDFDLGIDALAGFAIPIGFSLNLGYTFGLLNVSGNKNYISNLHNRYFGLTVGYEF